MMRSMEDVTSVESARLPLMEYFSELSVANLSTFRTVTGGFWLKFAMCVASFHVDLSCA